MAFYSLPTITKTLSTKLFSLPASKCTSTYSTAFPSPTSGYLLSHISTQRSQSQASDPTVRFVMIPTSKAPTAKAQPTTPIGRRYRFGSHVATSFAKSAFAIWHGMPTPAPVYCAPSAEPASTTCQSQRTWRVGTCSSNACGSRSRFSSGCTTTRTTNRIWRPSSDGRTILLDCRMMFRRQTSGKRLHTRSNPGSRWGTRNFVETWRSPFWGRLYRSRLRLCGSVELILVPVRDGHQRMKGRPHSFPQGACGFQDLKAFMPLIELEACHLGVYRLLRENIRFTNSVRRTRLAAFFFFFFFSCPFKNSEGLVANYFQP